MEKFLNKPKQYFKKTVNSMIDAEILGWPPTCDFIYNQPERPYKIPKDCLETNDIENE